MEYKGALKGFPQEIVEKMLERQFEQTGKRDLSIFEKKIDSNKNNRGFYWGDTVEGFDFWYAVLTRKHFNTFFSRYPKYPKVMMVSNNGDAWTKRVVFMEKCSKFIAWQNAETIEKAQTIVSTSNWSYAKDIEEPKILEVTIDEIADKFGVNVKDIKIKK